MRLYQTFSPRLFVFLRLTIARIPFPDIKVVSEFFDLAAKLARAQAYGAVGWFDYPVVTARTPLCSCPISIPSHGNLLRSGTGSASCSCVVRPLSHQCRSFDRKNRPPTHRAGGRPLICAKFSVASNNQRVIWCQRTRSAHIARCTGPEGVPPLRSHVNV